MNADREMELALIADGEKLRQLTGEDHGPWAIEDCPRMTELETARALRDAQQALKDAQMNYSKALRSLYPKGAYVRWKEGPYIMAGTVEGYTLAEMQLRVRPPHKPIQNVTVHAILALAEEEGTI